jgi:hypothetical protein
LEELLAALQILEPFVQQQNFPKYPPFLAVASFDFVFANSLNFVFFLQQLFLNL